jgi:CheY-like chemotaxis protein
MAREIKPDAITLDVHLPDFDGWRVLDRLKVDLATRHIPIQVISVDENTEPALTQGRWVICASRRRRIRCPTRSMASRNSSSVR